MTVQVKHYGKVIGQTYNMNMATATVAEHLRKHNRIGYWASLEIASDSARMRKYGYNITIL